MTQKQFRNPAAYQRRQGRLSTNQKALFESSPYLINNRPGFSFQTLQPGLYNLEIGVGMGDHLLRQASDYPDQKFIGIDLYKPGLCRILECIHQRAFDHVELLATDASELLPNLPKKLFRKIDVLHPDPWPKKRQHKRRLLNSTSIQAIVNSLTPSGYCMILTDHPDYTDSIIDDCSRLTDVLQYQITDHVPPLSKYGMKAIEEGRSITQITLAPLTTD